MIKLAGYKILKKLGSGGMGDVYLAEHELIHRKVAIKVLHKHLVSNKEFIKRFRREAKLLASLDHNNIVRLNEYFENKGEFYLIMEYVDGIELDQYINTISGPIVESELIPLFKQMLDAIGYAHKKGLVHRDIKPANILISKDGKVKVLDFGIAKLKTDDQGLTNAGVQVGTIAYMSPEQVRAEEVDFQSDIYSLGVTLYQMAVGKAPYLNSKVFDTQLKIVKDPLPKAQEIYPGVSDKLENIIQKATQKDKRNRYKSCEEFNKDMHSKNLVASEKIKVSTKEDVVKKKKKYRLSASVSFVVLLFVIVFSLDSYNRYESTSEIQKKESGSNKILNSITKTNNLESEITEEEKYDQKRLAEAKEAKAIKEIALKTAAQQKIIDDEKEKEKEKNKSEYRLNNFLSYADLYFDNSSMTLQGIGRDFVTNLLQNNYELNKFSPEEILIVDLKYIVFITIGDDNRYYCDIYDVPSETLLFEAKKLKSKLGVLTWSYSKSQNILCSDQGIGLMYRKNYFKLNQFNYSSSFKSFGAYFPFYINDLEVVPIYKWK